jgi:hypothetical protein
MPPAVARLGPVDSLLIRAAERHGAESRGSARAHNPEVIGVHLVSIFRAKRGNAGCQEGMEECTVDSERHVVAWEGTGQDGGTQTLKAEIRGSNPLCATTT